MRVRVVSRHEVAAGFALAGLEVIGVSDATSAASAVLGCAADTGTGVVLVDEELYRALPRDLLSHLDRRAVPIVAPVPAARWDPGSDAEAYILEILRQAIGYRVRPR